MTTKTQNELVGAVNALLNLKEARKTIIDDKKRHYQKYLKLKGKEQELSRQVNEAINELEKFRI